MSSASYDAIAVIDTVSGEVLKEYPLSFNVTAVASSVDGKRIYAGRAGDDGVDVAVIDVAAERVGTIYIAKGADATIDALRLDASGRRLYVAVSDARSSRLMTVDVETARVRSAFGDRCADPRPRTRHGQHRLRADIGHRRGRRALLRRPRRQRRRPRCSRVASTPTQLAVSDDGARAYVVDYDHVAVIDTDGRAVVAEVSVGARPSAITLHGGRLYVADYDGGVTTYAVASPKPMLYSPFVCAPALVVSALRELQPAV